MRGRILVRAAALPATAAVSARRDVPGNPLRVALRYEHHHNGRPATARLSTPLFGCHSAGRHTVVLAALRADRRHTSMPAALHSERHQHAH
jgi:hypothetical protein